MAPVIECDICVIGAGSAGLSVAAAAARFGEKVVLIEKAKMGGDCLNYGCVPSKALIAAARHAHGFANSRGFGIAAMEPQVDYAAVIAHVHAVIAAIAPVDSQERFEGLGVRVIRAAARFTSPAEVEVDGNAIRARRFVIATGSSPAIPPIPGLDEAGYLTNETLFDNRDRPRHLVIVGGGPIGIEMAQAHRRLGCQVTVVEAATPLAKDDPELAGVVLEAVRGEGVEILAGAKVEGVAKIATGIAVDVTIDGKARRLDGSHLLIATGRTATTAGLGLEAAGIAFDSKGITVDSGLRTTNPKVYAIGDVVGGLQFTHVASHHAGLVIRNALFRLPVRNRPEQMPWVTFTDPELAHVGLDEAAARQRHGDGVRVQRTPFEEVDRAQAERMTKGLIKVVTDRRGRILGAGIVGAHAGELILPWSLAVSSGLNVRALAGTVVPYPTLGDGSRKAALAHFSDLPTNAWVRHLIRWLKWLG